ncbi:MAG: 4Fe-4S double cluster binding domain-containing protein [Candidatus Sigynarchaeota archaeon]
MDFSESARKKSRELGIDLVGFADLSSFKAAKACRPADLLDPFSTAIAIAVHLADEVLDKIESKPTPEYNQAYIDANARLDAAATRIEQWIEEKGFHAKAIPASKMASEGRRFGAISHKAVAHAAGLGWQGKSLLLVTPDFGPRVRLATVLTDMPCKPGTMMPNRCGQCHACVDACPARAIKGTAPEFYHLDPNDGVDLDKCDAQLKEFGKLPGITKSVCGVCVAVCPWGKARKQES